MLVQFSFSNFKSFQETASLNLIEANITELSDSLLYSPKDELGILPLSVLYGANGSGKTSVLEAMQALGDTVHGNLNSIPAFYMNPDTTPVEFDITFRCKDMEFNYVLKTASKKVLEETYFYRTLPAPNYEVLFDRDKEGIFLGTPIEDMDVALLTDDQTMLSFLSASEAKGSKTDAAFIGLSMQWLSNLSVFRTAHGADTLLKVCETPVLKKQLLKMMASLGYKLEEISIDNEEPVLIHGDGLSLAWEAEAYGVKRILRLLSRILLSLNEGSLLLVDDINTSIHPKVLQALLTLYSDKKTNKNNAQLICTSTDMPAMHNSILRRDEIWMTEKKKSASVLYNLAEYIKVNGEKVRKDEIYYKQYLEGRYGALPQIK